MELQQGTIKKLWQNKLLKIIRLCLANFIQLPCTDLYILKVISKQLKRQKI